MNTNRPAPLDLAARERATRRLNQLTTGVALAGAIGVVGFGALAAVTDSGTATSASTVGTPSTTGTSTSTTGSDSSTTTSAGTTSSSTTLGRGVAPQPVTGAGHATTGGS